jgi:electron transfer flavoprotein alpha subunit
MIEPYYPPTEARGLWVFLEHEEGRLAGVSLELLGRGRALADATRQPLTGLLLGNGIDPLADEAFAYGADRVFLAEDRLLEPYTTLPFAKVVTELVLAHKPDIFLLGATPNGRDLAGRLAVRLRTGLTADCTDLQIDPASGLLLGEVTGFGRGILAMIQCPLHRPQMATVRPGVFPRPAAAPTRAGRIERVPVALTEGDRPVRVLERALKRGTDITQAERLVIAGRGMQGDMPLLERLATALDAEIGATRVAVDAGWVGHDRQIGQTGFVTRPKLAVVLGASGALQFTVGIADAETVVAINTDPGAPIFEMADYCIADDVAQVVPELIDALERAGAGRTG